MDIGGGLKKCKHILYRDPLKRLIERAGLEVTLARLYANVLRRTSSDTIEYSINDQSASFYRSEYLPVDLPERPVVEDLIENLHPDDVFFDLGANHGIYTCLAGTRLNAGSVVSFEPNPETCAELRQNVALNDLTDRVTIFQAAVADESGKADLFSDKNMTGSSLVESQKGSGTQTIQVDVVALDSLVDAESLPIPDVVKIDVEGAELQALHGMRSLLEDQCRLIYCEVHDSAVTGFDTTQTDVERFLCDAGFDVETIFEREADHCILKATR
jgi:FkbM family methyltransferase